MSSSSSAGEGRDLLWRPPAHPGRGGEGSLQLREQAEHVGRVRALLPGGTPQLHRVEAGVGRRELLGAVKFVQEEPGGVRVDFHQVEENAVERWKRSLEAWWGASGLPAPPGTAYWAICEKN